MWASVHKTLGTICGSFKIEKRDRQTDRHIAEKVSLEYLSARGN